MKICWFFFFHFKHVSLQKKKKTNKAADIQWEMKEKRSILFSDNIANRINLVQPYKSIDIRWCRKIESSSCAPYFFFSSIHSLSLSASSAYLKNYYREVLWLCSYLNMFRILFSPVVWIVEMTFIIYIA